MDRIFEWDDHKAEANYRKHGVRFEDAALIFDDPFVISVQDRIEHGEERWQSIGVVEGCVMLMVAHTVKFENEGIEVVRIISARCVDRKERRLYEHG